MGPNLNLIKFLKRIGGSFKLNYFYLGEKI